VLPSFVMVVAIGAVYTRYGGISWMQAVFYGVGAAVIGIIAIGAYKLTTKNIGKDRSLCGICLLSAAVTMITKSEIVWLFLGAGVLVWRVRAPPKAWSGGALHSFAAPLLGWLALDNADWHKLGQIGAHFAYAGSFVFGSGLAIVPFLYGGVVQEYHWLTDRQFVDVVAVAMITPGPVVITTGFIGYLVAGFWGAVVATLGTSFRATSSSSCRRLTSRSTANAPASSPSSTASRPRPSVQSRELCLSLASARSRTGSPPVWRSWPRYCSGVSRNSRNP